MTLGNSRPVSSNQSAPHDKLAQVVVRHLQSPSRKPISAHTADAFEQAQQWLGHWQGALIFDSCCGVGESTTHLAKQFPQARIIGLDKSAQRVAKHDVHFQPSQDNYLILRADVNDFWRLAADHQWQLSQHFLLYPNPYPKSAHLQRRWHGSPAFRDLIRLGGCLIVRSNWNIYVEEFAQALAIAGCTTQATPYSAAESMTAFERKYWASGQRSWQLVAQIAENKVKSLD